MKRLFALIALVITLIGSAGLCLAEEPIWIEPGKSVGKVTLGMTIGDVINQIGIFDKIEEKQPLPFADMHYPLMTIQVSYLKEMKGMIEELKRGTKPDPSKWKAYVDWITTYDPKAKTRGSIGVGSSLKAVLDVFGDTQVRETSSTPLKLVKCGHVDVYKFPQNRPSSLRSHGEWPYVLSVDYANEGISFYFKIHGKDQTLTVYAITISDRKDCEVLIGS